MNTTLNSTVSFSCEAVAEDIVFRVNDMSFSISTTAITNIGFTQKKQDPLKTEKNFIGYAFHFIVCLAWS